MDFDNPKVYGDTSITDGLVFKMVQFLSGRVLPNKQLFIHPCTTANSLNRRQFKLLGSGWTWVPLDLVRPP